MQIILADMSMSLDNVLAVAGRGERSAVGAGSAGWCFRSADGPAAGMIARLLERHRWIAWVGLLIVLYVAAEHDLARRPRRRWRAIA